MKKILFGLLAILSLSELKATVRTVSNDPNGGAEYSTLLAAYTAAVNGDTLYLEGTDINYEISDNGSPWAKSLVVMGIGIRPVKTNPRKTKIRGNGGGSFFMNALASGSKFHGIQFQTSNSFSGTISNITYENCSFLSNYETSGIHFNNFVFRNCWFHTNIGFNGNGNINNILLTSCIVNGFIDGATNGVVSNFIIDHCIFLTSGNITTGVKNATISNSIFMNSNNLGSFNNCTIAYNIARLNNVFPPSGTGITFGGNIDNTDPMLVNCPINTGFDAGINHNYHLLTGSPCIGAGTGGSDIGPHGSLSKFSETGEVLFAPIMRTLFINNTTVVPNGTLNVNISASKPYDN